MKMIEEWEAGTVKKGRTFFWRMVALAVVALEIALVIFLWLTGGDLGDYVFELKL